MLSNLPEPVYLDRIGLARYLSVSLSTIQRWTHRRLIPFIKIGGQYRYKIAEVEEAMKTQFRKPHIRQVVPRIRRPRTAATEP